jgi:AraC family transcriptional regulator
MVDTYLERQAAPGPGHARQPESAAVEAISAMSQILDHAPLVVEAVLGCDTRLTQRWAHGAIHDVLPALDTHVVMTFYGNAARDTVLRTEGSRVAARTKAGTITVIPLGQDGRWDIDGPLEVSHVYLPDARLQAAADQLNRGQKVDLLGRVAFEDHAAARLLEMLSQETGLADPSSRLFVEQAVDLLCTQLIRGHSSFGALTIEAPRRGLADWQVRKVTAYMREHLEEEIGLDELASLVSLSRFHFGTAFRMATGRTPHEWLVAERMERAQALLRDPLLPVTEIALTVGYQTPSSFAAAFRKVVGVTPSDYRRRL